MPRSALWGMFLNRKFASKVCGRGEEQEGEKGGRKKKKKKLILPVILKEAAISPIVTSLVERTF